MSELLLPLVKEMEELMEGSYPAIHKWLRHLYWDIPAFGTTTNFEHIKKACTVLLCSTLLLELTWTALYKITFSNKPVRYYACWAAAGYHAEGCVGYIMG